MNAQQAKSIDFPDLLARLGYYPSKSAKQGRELWYTSPLRNEKTPSFHTSFLGGKWIWNDFGDSGGNVIDFVMHYNSINTVKEALKFLRGIYQNDFFYSPTKTQSLKQPTFSFQQQATNAYKEHSSLQFLEASPIQNTAIYTYLEKERKIPAKLADRYLKEIRYWNTNKEKEFFAFGMENQSGGDEIRSASSSYSFKSALITRDITFVNGAGRSKAVNIFEGMTDFLSLLVMLNTEQLQGDAIIMHSLSSFRRATAHMAKAPYEVINLFLDNNKAGRSSVCRFKEHYGKHIRDFGSRLGPFEDLNAALQNGFIPDFSCTPLLS